MARVVAAQDAGKVAAELFDLRVPHTGSKDLFQQRQLLCPDELFVIEKPPVFDDGMPKHVLDAIGHAIADGLLFHWKITSTCVQWKHWYKYLSVRSGRVVFRWNAVAGLRA
jgi:hypothetical protein